MRRVVMCVLMLAACDASKRVAERPKAADEPNRSYVSHNDVEIKKQPLTYCAPVEAIRDCMTGGAIGNEAGWDYDRPGPNEVQVAGYGPQGFQCKIVYCGTYQPIEGFSAGAVTDFARFRLSYGIDRQRNGYNAYSELWGNTCWDAPLMHQQWGRYEYYWGYNHPFKSMLCFPNAQNANPMNW